MDREDVEKISKDVFWDKFKMLVAIGSLIIAIQDFWDVLVPVNKYDDRVRTDFGGDECSRSEG